jgi:hypothetical protein
MTDCIDADVSQPGKEYKGIAAKPKYMGDMPITRAAAAQIQQQPMRRERLEVQRSLVNDDDCLFTSFVRRALCYAVVLMQTKRRASRAVSYKEAEEEFEFDLGSSSDEEERSRKKRKEAAGEMLFTPSAINNPNVHGV